MKEGYSPRKLKEYVILLINKSRLTSLKFDHFSDETKSLLWLMIAMYTPDEEIVKSINSFDFSSFKFSQYTY